MRVTPGDLLINMLAHKVLDLGGYHSLSGRVIELLLLVYETINAFDRSFIIEDDRKC